MKVFSLSGTSSLVIGRGKLEKFSSQSKTTNGVGSAYGDGSYINMSPYHSPVNDPQMISKKKYPKYTPYYFHVATYPYLNLIYPFYHYNYLPSW